MSTEETTIDTTTPEATVETAAPESSAPQTAAPEATAYTPDWKVKVLNEEREVDEFFRPLVKDPDTEKKVKEVFEKMYSMEHFKNKYEKTHQQYQEVLPKYQQYEQSVNALKKYWGTDKDMFFQALGVDQKDIYKWVAEKLQYQELPEDQKALYDNSREKSLEAMRLQEENQFYKQRMEQEAVQARTFQLDQSLAKPEVGSLQSRYDEIYGPGAFRSEVINTGKQTFQMSGKDISPEEAIHMVMSKHKPMLDRLGSGSQSVQQATIDNKPVIPAIKAGSGSPAKKKIGSLDELRKLAAQYQDQ